MVEARIIEDFLISGWIACMILGFFYSSVGLITDFLELSLLAWLVFDKVPFRLDSSFKTTKFTVDMSLRMGVCLTSFSIFFAFFIFGLSTSDWYFPTLPRVSLSYSISIPLFFLVVLTVFLSSILYLSWRLGKYPNLVRLSIRKLYRSEQEFQRDFEQVEVFRSMKKYVAPGVFLAGVSVLLAFGLFLLSVLDILFLAFLLVWLIFNLRNVKDGYSFWRQLDEMLVWRGLALEGARITVEGFAEVLLLLIAFMVVSLLALPNLGDFVGMVFFGYWYILLILFQIVMRLRFRLGFSRVGHTKGYIPTLPPDADLIIGFYMFVMTLFLLSYHLERLWLSMAAFLLFIPANIAGVKSVLSWSKKKDEIRRQTLQTRIQTAKTMLNFDRYRSIIIAFGITIPIMVILYDVEGTIWWAMMLGAVVIMGSFDKFSSKIDKMNVALNATLKTSYFSLICVLVLLSASHMYPGLSSLIYALTVAFVVALAIYWIITYRGRKYSASNRSS